MVRKCQRSQSTLTYNSTKAANSEINRRNISIAFTDGEFLCIVMIEQEAKSVYSSKNIFIEKWI
jgi:hypothetical protein